MARLSKKHLKEENYIEALSIVCQKVMKFKTPEGQDKENERIYSHLMDMAERYDGEDEEQDYFDNVERIWSAVACAIEW